EERYARAGRPVRGLHRPRYYAQYARGHLMPVPGPDSLHGTMSFLPLPLMICVALLWSAACSSTPSAVDASPAGLAPACNSLSCNSDEVCTTTIPFLLRANLTAQLHLHVAPFGVSPREKSPYDGASFVSCVATSAAAIVLPALPGHGDPRISFSVVTLPFAKQTFWGWEGMSPQPWPPLSS